MPLLVPQTLGVRHLSPAGALHVERCLEAQSPEVVLVEGPSGAESVLAELAHEDTLPPVALLGFTRAAPVAPLFLPFASYSPEWVALRWAVQHRRPFTFIDLPVEVFLGLRGAPGEEETPG